MLTHSRGACNSVERVLWRVLERLWRWLACQSRFGQGRQSARPPRALLVGPIAVKPQQAWAIAFDGAMSHYGYDIAFLADHEQTALVNAVVAEHKAGGTVESCMMVAAIRLREIYPQVNGVKERA